MGHADAPRLTMVGILCSCRQWVHAWGEYELADPSRITRTCPEKYCGAIFSLDAEALKKAIVVERPGGRA